MGKEARNPMTTAQEVVAWAESTKAANGTAFTMLNKAEQLLIANFILEMKDYIHRLNMVEKVVPTVADESKPRVEAESAHNEGEIVVRDEVKQDGEKVVQPVANGKGTRMDYFNEQGTGMQIAYNTFLEWQAEDPKKRMIYDSVRKGYSNAAAFAYWLMQKR